MEKGFRIVQCLGCSVRLRVPVSEKDYGTTKIVRCPKCGAQGRIEIPCPAPEISSTKKPLSPSPGDISQFPQDFFGDIFDDIFKREK